jgi:hypothetical protein
VLASVLQVSSGYGTTAETGHHGGDDRIGRVRRPAILGGKRPADVGRQDVAGAWGRGSLENHDPAQPVIGAEHRADRVDRERPANSDSTLRNSALSWPVFTFALSASTMWVCGVIG